MSAEETQPPETQTDEVDDDVQVDEVCRCGVNHSASGQRAPRVTKDELARLGMTLIDNSLRPVVTKLFQPKTRAELDDKAKSNDNAWVQIAEMFKRLILRCGVI
jgi:hypothetical protein